MTGKNSTCFNYLHTLHGDDKTIPGSLTVSHTEEPGAQLGSRLHNPALVCLTHCPSQETFYGCIAVSQSCTECATKQA